MPATPWETRSSEVSLTSEALAANDAPAAQASSVARTGPLRRPASTVSPTTAASRISRMNKNRSRCAELPPCVAPRDARNRTSPVTMNPPPSQSRACGLPGRPSVDSGSVNSRLVTCSACTTDTEPRCSAAACTKYAVVPTAQPANQSRS